MSKSIRRADKNKRDEIRRVRQYFLEAGATPEEAYFAQLKKVPNATEREHCWALNYVALGNSPPDCEWMRNYRDWERFYNKSTRNPDERVVGVAYDIQDIHGNPRLIWFRQLAVDEGARQAANRCDAPIDGWQKRKKELTRMSRDGKLKARHDSKMRELERRARRGKGKP